MGVAGNSTTKTSILGNESKKKKPIDWSGNDFNRTDYGVSLGLGVQISSFDLGVGYQFGLANLLDTNNELKQQNRLFYISLGLWL